MGRMKVAAVAAIALAAGMVATPAHAAWTCFGKVATIVGTDRDNTIKGTPRQDVIWAGLGDDTVYGRGGNDLICGGSGEDRGLYGNKGNDKIDAGTSTRATLVYGGKGDDLLYDAPNGGDAQEMFGGPGDDVLKAGDSNGTYLDVLDGGPGDDVMEQGETEGIFYAGPGNDVIWGGRGGGDRDELILTDAPRGIRLDMRDETMRGWGRDEVAEIEIVMGSRFDDTISGDEDRNVFVGAAGDDKLSGGASRDCILGGAVEFWNRCYFAYEVDPGSGDDVLAGGDGDDDLVGGDGDDRFTGGTGTDTAWFSASRAPVAVDLGEGSATGEGRDTLDVEGAVGSEFADALTGSEASDRLHAGTSRASRGDVLRGLGGDDTLGVQYDTDLDGGAGSDTASYAFTFNDGVTTVDLRTDSDTLGNTLTDVESVYGLGHNTMAIHGDDGPNTLTGSGGNDEIFGYDGDDRLKGGFGDDLLDGGPGNDTLDGGHPQHGGNDTCVNGETVTSCEQ
ncbi:MAG TPA: hypothetical protein VHJ76_04075 [Actinomycetota bacterium]|nr:hypothetical protein [Actinomycetota bacterium]